MKKYQSQIVIEKRIKGFEDYSVDTNGEVYSYPRLGKTKNEKVKRRYGISKIKLKQWINKYGYPEVVIRNRITKKSKTFRVYKLVALAFIPNRKNKPCINHINGKKLDSSVKNLEWVTYSENELHSYRKLGKKPISNQLGKIGINSLRGIPVKVITDKKTYYFGSERQARLKLTLIKNKYKIIRITKKQYNEAISNKNGICRLSAIVANLIADGWKFDDHKSKEGKEIMRGKFIKNDYWYFVVNVPKGIKNA